MIMEAENARITELRDIEQQKRALIQKIVDARLAGFRDEKSIEKLGRLSQRKLSLVRPAALGDAA
jgi:hypothetical protein